LIEVLHPNPCRSCRYGAFERRPAATLSDVAQSGSTLRFLQVASNQP
jgi:hypothetical protein